MMRYIVGVDLAIHAEDLLGNKEIRKEKDYTKTLNDIRLRTSKTI